MKIWSKMRKNLLLIHSTPYEKLMGDKCSRFFLKIYLLSIFIMHILGFYENVEKILFEDWFKKQVVIHWVLIHSGRSIKIQKITIIHKEFPNFKSHNKFPFPFSFSIFRQLQQKTFCLFFIPLGNQPCWNLSQTKEK